MCISWKMGVEVKLIFEEQGLAGYKQLRVA